jgi:hypothetical protein
MKPIQLYQKVKEIINIAPAIMIALSLLYGFIIINESSNLTAQHNSVLASNFQTDSSFIDYVNFSKQKEVKPFASYKIQIEDSFETEEEPNTVGKKVDASMSQIFLSEIKKSEAKESSVHHFLESVQNVKATSFYILYHSWKSNIA